MIMTIIKIQFIYLNSFDTEVKNILAGGSKCGKIIFLTVPTDILACFAYIKPMFIIGSFIADYIANE